MNELLNILEDTGQVLEVAVAGVFDAASLRGVSDTDLLEVLRRASALSRQAEALLVEATGEIAERSSSPDRSARLTTRVQCRNVNEVVTRMTRISARRATEWERAAADVRNSTSISSGELLPPQFPALRDALGEGEISVDGVRAATGPLHDASARIDTDQRLQADEQLAAMTRGHGPDGAPPAGADELKVFAQALALYLDPDGAEPRAAHALLKRGVTLGKGRDGLVTISGRLLPEVAAQFQRITDSILNPRVPEFVPTGETTDAASSGTSDAVTGGATGEATDGASGTSGHDGDAAGAADGQDWRGGRPDASEVTVPMDMSAPAWGQPDQRTPAQKRHDALATALVAAAGSGQLPTLGGEAPTLVVLARQDDLDRGRGAAHVTEHDQPVALAAARHVACTGRVERVTIDANGRIIELRSDERCFTKKQRRAIASRDGGCIIPGCTVPANWCEVHHVLEWAKGGRTHPDNGVLLCWTHHRTLEETGWQIRMRDGIPEVQAPAWWDPARTWRPATKSAARIRNLIEDERYPWVDDPEWTPPTDDHPTASTAPTPPTESWPADPASPRQPAPQPSLLAADPRPWGQHTETPAMKRPTERPTEHSGVRPRHADSRPWGQSAKPATRRPTDRPTTDPPRAQRRVADPRPWGQPADGSPAARTGPT